MRGRYSGGERRLRVEPLERRELLSAVGWSDAAAVSARASAADDYGNTIATATAVTLSDAGAAGIAGKIEKRGDADMFQVTATVTGEMTVKEAARGSSRLDTYLYVYDSDGTLLARNDDYGRSRNSQVTIDVTAGETYYVKAAGYRQSTGAYTVRWTTAAAIADDYGDTLATATTVTLSDTGAATQSGTIEEGGDADVFQVVATVTGEMTVAQSAASGSRLDAYLYVYDSTGQLLAQNDDSGMARDSQVEVSVTAGETYYVKAAGYRQSVGAYTVTITTAEETAADPSEDGFQIDATLSGMTDTQTAAVEAAIDLWESVIVGDLADVTVRGQTIDDLTVSISSIAIDGEGNVLGQAAVTGLRSDSYLPYSGYIELDSADIASLTSSTLTELVVHELAHVLGFGVIWSDLGLLTGADSSSPGFTGANAVAAYNALFGTTATAVPVEADGGSGTALSHWDETVFDNELMTGWYNSGEENPLSLITVASMADLGYTVNLAAAEAYTAPTTTTTTSASTVSGALVGGGTSSSRSALFESDSQRSRAVDLILTGLYGGPAI